MPAEDNPPFLLQFHFFDHTWFVFMSAEGLADGGRKSIEEKALLAGLPKTAGAGQLLKSIK